MDRVSRILVGIDLHGDASDVVAKGARLASAFGATLELFAPVYNSLVSRAHFPETGALERARQRLVHSGLERLKTLEAALGGTVEVECEAAWDHPAEEAVIRRAMQSRADLVVVALQPHPEHRFPFFSGADWQLARQCPVPVLLCRPGRWKARPVIVAAIDPLPHRGRKASLDIRILRAADAVGRACGGELRTFHAYEPITPVAGTSVLVELPVDQAEQALEGGPLDAREGEGAGPAAVLHACILRHALGSLAHRLGVPAEARVDVGVVDPGGEHLHQHFSRTGEGRRDGLVPQQLFRAAMARKLNAAHGLWNCHPCLRATRTRWKE